MKHVRSSARIVTRVSVLFALALAGASLTGCGARSLLARRHAGPAAPRVAGATRPPAAETRAARAVRDANDPYWAYERATHQWPDSVEQAEASLREALALSPSYAPAMALLSKLYFSTQRHAEAIALLEPVRQQPENYPAHERARLLAGLALHEDALGNAVEARSAIGSAYEASRRDEASAVVYVTLRGPSPDSATALAQEALRRDPKSAVSQNNAGITRLRSGDVDGARRAFEAAIERDPGLPGPYYNLAILEKYYRFDDASAERWFGQYWNRSHDDPDGLRAVFSASVAQATPQQGDRP